MLEVTGSGSDIQQNGGQFDQFRFVGAAFSGDYSVSARILEKPSRGPGNNETWIKAGVMLRENLDPGARMMVAFLTQGQGVGVEYRLAYRSTGPNVGDNSVYGGYAAVADSDVKTPVWLKITKAGENMTSFYSTDGTTFTAMEPPAGKDVNFPRLPGVTYAGLAVTSHSEGTLATAKFDAKYGIKIE